MHPTHSNSGTLPARVAMAALTLALVACGGSPTENSNDDASMVAQIVPPAMERGIVELLDRWTDAWTAKDATAFASVYAVDADFVNPLGQVTPGRAAIEAAHTFLFGALFAGSQQTWEIRRLVALTGAVALVDLNVDLAGFQGVPPGLPVSPDGIVRTRVRLIVARTGGTFEIHSQQMTAYVP